MNDFKQYIQTALSQQALSAEDIATIVHAIENNDFEPMQLGALLTAIEARGHDSNEIHYFVHELMKRAKTISLGSGCVDVCGTGGDGSQTFNISTAVALVTAAAGVPVAKHGNRAISSKSGSFDVLESLGVDCSLDKTETLFKAAGIGFLFAPNHHPVFKYIGPVRKALGIRTIFNFIGPLLNPAHVNRQVMGVFDPQYGTLIAETMNKNGTVHGMVVHGDGLDEITVTGTSQIVELKDGDIRSYEFDPREYGISLCTKEDLVVDSPTASAKAIESILAGEKSAKRDIVVVNAAAALIVGGRATDFTSGIALAEQTIDSGKAKELLETLRGI